MGHAEFFAEDLRLILAAPRRRAVNLVEGDDIGVGQFAGGSIQIDFPVISLAPVNVERRHAERCRFDISLGLSGQRRPAWRR